MELDKLKEAWASVDERLKENEMLNKRIVQEMLSDKSNKSLNKLINYELINVIVCLSVIPICIWALMNTRFTKFLSPKLLFVVTIIIAIIGIVLSSYILKKYLLKIDFSKNIKDNMYYLNKFIIYYRKSKMINYYIIIPVISALCIFAYYEHKVPFYMWVYLSVGLIIGIGATYWIYKKIYDVNIQSIQKSLDELKELKEE